MDLYLPSLGDESVLIPLPTKTDVYRAALTFRPEIESGKLNVQASDLDISIAKAPVSEPPMPTAMTSLSPNR